MAVESQIVGAVTGTGADVNASRQLQVTAETDFSANPGNVGTMRMVSENDPGDVTGSAYLKSPEVSDDYRLRVGIDTVLFQDTCNATTQNTSKWAYTFATLTAAQPGTGTVNFSTVQGTTSAHGAFMRTFQYFPIFGTAPIWHEEVWGQSTAALVTNEVWASGLGVPVSATAPPTDGVWWQLTSAGVVGRVCFNGIFTDTGVLSSFASYAVGTLYKHSVLIGENVIEWWRDDILLGTTPVPAGNGQPFLQGSLPAFRMKYNTGNVANTNIMRVCETIVTLADLQTAKPWSHQMSSLGQSALLGQDGGTQGKSQWWTNNTAPTAAAATNTAAIAGATTLGGLVSVLPTLTANNDGNLFTFTNPASTINITGRNLIITGVKVQGAVTVVFVGGPVIYAYAVAFGHTNVSLATTETASFATGTTHAPRTAFVGMESYAATAAVGTLGQGCTLDLSNGPIVVRPGEQLALMARNMGTVTSSGALTIGCTFVGYYE